VTCVPLLRTRAGAFVAIGPDEERILTDRYSVTVTPGEHFWSASVERLRFGTDDVAAQVTEIRGLVADRGRNAAAWTVGPSATPDGLLELLVAMGMKSESDEGSLMLVLTEPPQIQAFPFEVRLVTSYADHLAAIEVANQGFAFPSEDALDERRRARASFQSERAGGHSVRLLVVDGDRPVAAGRAWLSPFGLYLGGGATIPSERRPGRHECPGRQGLGGGRRPWDANAGHLGWGDGHRRPAAHRLSCGRSGVAPGGSDRPLSLPWTRIQRSA
jgi:hypothetical protein